MITSPRKRRGVRLAVVLAGIGLLAGCVSLPTSGEVNEGTGMPSAEPGQPHLQAQGPRGGERPAEIVEGFLLAHAAWQDTNYDVAQSFLTTEARQEWLPGDGVLVHRGDQQTRLIEPPQPVEDIDAAGPEAEPETVEEEPDSGEIVLDPQAREAYVQLEVSGVASVESNGVRSELDPSVQVPFEFRLMKNDDGEWRIANLPNGLIMNETNFSSVHQRVQLYFFSDDRSLLIPDTRWFPNQNTASFAIQELLAGPAPQWQGSMWGITKSATSLVHNAVTVEGGIAEVELTDGVLGLTTEERSLFYAQVQATLRSWPSQILGVKFTVRNTEVTMGDPAVIERDPSPGEVLYAVREGEIIPIEGGAPGESRGVLPETISAKDYLVFSKTGQVIATLNEARTFLQIFDPATGAVLSDLRGVNLSVPTQDRFGWVWTSQQRVAREGEIAHSEFVALNADGRISYLSPAWLEGKVIDSLALSRDGARIALVNVHPAGPAIEIAGIVRDGDGTPLRVGESTKQGRMVQQARSVQWLDEATLAVLGTSRLASREVIHLVEISGDVEALSSLDSVQAFAAGKARSTIFVLNEAGQVYHRVGMNWISVLDQVTWLQYPVPGTAPPAQ